MNPVLRPAAIAVIVLAVIASAAALYVLHSILIPFVLAGLLSILFRPLVSKLRSWKFPMAVCLVVVMLIASGALWGIYTISAAGVSSAIEKAPAYQQRLTDLNVQMNGLLQRMSIQMTGRSSALRWDSMFDMQTITSAATSTVGSVVSFLGDGFLVLLYLVFMISSSELFSKKLQAAAGSMGSMDLVQIYDTVNRKVLQYLRVKTLFNLVNGLIVWAVMAIFDIDFAPLVGLLAFLFHYIPNIGSFITTALPGAIALVQTGSFGHAALVVAILIVIQNVIGNVIEPKVMGQSLDLSPVVVLISLIFWGWMWGIVGMILSVPIMAVIQTILDAIPGTRPLAILMGGSAPRTEPVPNE